MGIVKKGCGYSGLRTLKLAVSQEEINGIDWFWCVDKNLGKLKVNFNKFWVVVFKNGHGLVGLAGSLKSAVSQEWINEMSWYKFRKVKSYFINDWVGMVKNGQGLIDHGTLESGV